MSEQRILPTLVRVRRCRDCGIEIEWRPHHPRCWWCWRAFREKQLVAQGRIYMLRWLPSEPPSSGDAKG